MRDLWRLPDTAVIGGREYRVNPDFRDILEIIGYLNDPQEPEYIRWQIALGLFFEDDIPEADQQEAMEYLADFLSGGQRDEAEKPAPVLLDWEQDCQVIVAEVNKVAGQEIRSLPFLHWWTFLSWFHGIGEGQLLTLVSIRDKLRRGKKLEKWEQEYYREHKSRVDLKQRYTAEELAQQERLKKLLEG